MEETDSPREVNHSESRPSPYKKSHSPCIRSKAKDVAMFISVGSSSTKQSPQQPTMLSEHRANTPEWHMNQTSSITSSTSHNTVVGGLMLNRGTATSPMRRISAASGLQSRIAARRVALNHPRTNAIETRFGRARKNLSKTVHSMQLMRSDLGEQTDSMGLKSLQSIATQTIESDEITGENIGNAAAEAYRRLSRIPVPREKLITPRDKTPVQTCVTSNSSEPYSKFALGNVYSLMTMSVSETKLEEIRSSSSISVTVRPVVEAQESCTVMDVNILRLAEIRSKELDIDRTLENWKPTTAEVSLVPDEKPKLKTKKSIVKKERTKVVEKPKKEDWKSTTENVPIIDLDKEAFKVPVSKSRNTSEKRSSQREHSGDRTTNRNEEKEGEKHIDSPGSGSGSNFRVRFSPQLTTPAASTSGSRGKFSSTLNKMVSPTASKTSIPKYPELVKRVTDKAITSIAKSVILGLPAQTMSRYEPHPTISRYEPHATMSFSNYRLPMPSPSFSGNYRPYPNYSRMPPMTMSSMNVHHDDTNMGFRLPSRNASQVSLSSMMNFPNASGSLIGGMHSSGRFPYYSSHNRMMSAHSMQKSRKEFDNRYLLHHHLHHSNMWDTPPSQGPAPKNPWLRDSSYVYNMHSGEYGPRPGPSAANSQFWLRYQQLKSKNVPWSTTSSSSSIYSPQGPSKYDRPSQRFSLIRNHGGMRSSMENLNGSIMSKKAMESGGGGGGGRGIGHLHRPMPMESMLNDRPVNTPYNEHPYQPYI